MNIKNVEKARDFTKSNHECPLDSFITRQLNEIIVKHRETNVPYDICVVGDMGVGKSTFLNGILGMKLLPSITTKACSATPVRIGYHTDTFHKVKIMYYSFAKFKEMLQTLIASIDENGEKPDEQLLSHLRNGYEMFGSGNKEILSYLEDGDHWKNTSVKNRKRIIKENEWKKIKQFGETKEINCLETSQVFKLVDDYGSTKDNSESFTIREIEITTNCCPWLGEKGFIIDLRMF